MTTATAISILVALFKETAYSVADNFISSETASDLIKLASDIFEDSAEAKVELEALLAEVRAHKAESAANGEVWKPTLEQIEKHLGEINARTWGDNPSRDDRFPDDSPVYLGVDPTTPGADRVERPVMRDDGGHALEVESAPGVVREPIQIVSQGQIEVVEESFLPVSTEPYDENRPIEPYLGDDTK